jgi:ATP-binding protein involved in chromosome partitioning
MSNSKISQIEINNALKTVKYPGFSRDILSFGLVKTVEWKGSQVTVNLHVTTADKTVPGKLHSSVQSAVGAIPGVEKVDVNITVDEPKNRTMPTVESSEGVTKLREGSIRYIVAIASGKGGVGKSTFCVNFAAALATLLKKEGGRVGVLDCDIYGPSVPLMLGLDARPEIEGESILPIEAFGLKVMSMGFLIDENAPVVWRGPMINKVIQQFVQNVRWGDLDVLVVDLPPGTGDAQLTLTQTLPLTGAIILTTPQAAAVTVATRGAAMFAKVNVPLLGVVENMSYFLDTATGEHLPLFGAGGGEQASQVLGCPLLGKIPLDPNLRLGADMGMPLVLSHPEAQASKSISEIAKQIWEKMNLSLM